MKEEVLQFVAMSILFGACISRKPEFYTLPNPGTYSLYNDLDKALPEDIARLSKLKTLVVKDNLFSEEEKTRIVKALPGYTVVF